MKHTITITEINRQGRFTVRCKGTVLINSARTPLLDAARALLRKGASPDDTIVLVRDGAESLRARLGYAATLTIDESKSPPRFAKWKPHPRRLNADC